MLWLLLVFNGGAADDDEDVRTVEHEVSLDTLVIVVVDRIASNVVCGGAAWEVKVATADALESLSLVCKRPLLLRRFATRESTAKLLRDGGDGGNGSLKMGDGDFEALGDGAFCAGSPIVVASCPFILQSSVINAWLFFSQASRTSPLAADSLLFPLSSSSSSPS